jgi:hypothetical protein
MATTKEKIRAAIEDAQAYISMRVSGRFTKHLFDPLTLIGGVAVLVLVLLLLALGFSGAEPTQQRKHGADAGGRTSVSMALPRPQVGNRT